jgi:acyl dehydratase
MVEKEMSLEERMTPEEREFFEKYRRKIGQVHIPPNDQEAMANERCIYFWGLGKEATWTWIKRWATINEDFNALWFDEEYAKKSRWGGIVAPPLYLISVQDGLAAPMEPWWDLHLPGGLTPNREKYPNYVATPQGESEWEFFEPVRPGDTINAEHKLADLAWHKAKEGKEYSRILYIVGETTFTNQKGQLVGRNRSTGLVLFK